MAISFAAGNDMAQFASAPVTVTPLTLACWINPNSTLGNVGIFGVYSSSTQDGFYLSAGTNTPSASIFQSNSFTSANATAALTNGTWGHVAAVYTSATSRDCYLNGGNKGSDTTSKVPVTINNTTVGAFISAGSDFAHADAQFADAAIWNAALDAGEIAALAKGYSALLIRPANLVLYVPFIRTLQDYIGGSSMSLFAGGTTTAHPRIIMQRGPKFQRYRPVVVVNVYVYMRPDADQSDGSWLNELGSNVDLYASVDETVASDTDYIQSSTTSGDKVRLRLSNPGSAVAEPFAIRYRASATTGTASIYGRLYQGVTLIDSWNHTVDTTPTDYTHTLGTTEFASISDFDDLFIEFEYVP